MVEQQKFIREQRGLQRFLIWLFAFAFLCVISPCIWIFYSENFVTWWSERNAQNWLDETYPVVVNATDDTRLSDGEEPEIRKQGTMVCVGADALLHFSTNRSFDEVLQDYDKVFNDDWRRKTWGENGTMLFYIPDNRYIRAVIIRPEENLSSDADIRYQVDLWFDECRCSEARELVCS